MDIVNWNDVNNLANEGLRKNGRQFFEFRDVIIQLYENSNSLTVVIGNTVVLATVLVSRIVPTKDRASEGRFSIKVNTNRVKLTNVRNDDSDLSRELKSIEDQLLELFLVSKAIDTSALCIIRGAEAYNVEISLTIINYDGAIKDACSLAVVSALKLFRVLDMSCNAPCTILVEPMFVTFALVPSNSTLESAHILADPDLVELQGNRSSVTLGLNVYGNVAVISHIGAIHFTVDMLEKLSSLAVARIKSVKKIIDDKFNEFAKNKVTLTF